MNRFVFLLTFLVLAISSIPIGTNAQPVFEIEDLEVAVGSWTGELTYLDYSSNKEVSIKAAMEIEIVDPSSGTFAITMSYPDEPSAGGREEFVIGGSGTKIGDARVISVSRALENVRLITEEIGDDNGRPSTFRTIFRFGKSSFTQTRLVRPNDSVEFFRRNAIQMRR